MTVSIPFQHTVPFCIKAGVDVREDHRIPPDGFLTLTSIWNVDNVFRVLIFGLFEQDNVIFMDITVNFCRIGNGFIRDIPYNFFTESLT